MTQQTLFNTGDNLHYQPQDFIILSLKPYAWDKIKGGGKRMEYRTRFRKRPTIAIIYVSAPVMEIRGFMVMGQPIINTPDEIGKLAERHIPGNGHAVYEYLKNARQAYAIPILKYVDILPMPLAELRTKYNFTPPQSYVGLSLFPQLEMDLMPELKRHW